MSRRVLALFPSVLFAFAALLLAGCCSSSVRENSNACEARWERSRHAAEKGWANVQEGLSPPIQPALHEGMTASEAKDALGAPPRREERPQGERWTYPERALVVLIEDGTVAGWERREATPK